MSSVIGDVHFEILLRVPARTALICKCVCKSWFQIISDRSFVKLHLNLSIERNNTRLVLKDKRNKFYSVGYDSISSVTETEYDAFVFDNLDPPFESLKYRGILLGSCDGIVCLKYTNFEDVEFLCLWNPVTREQKKLPKSPRNYEKFECGAYCFGYDRMTDDYKLITVVPLHGQKKNSLVEVYTLGTDSWKNSQILPYNMHCIGKNYFFNGAWHWLAEMGEKETLIIISLDVSKEKFDELQLPSKLLKDEYWILSIGVLDGCLGLVVKDLKVSYCFEFWVMKNYGVHESWTKHYSIALEGVQSAPYLRVICSFKNGKILLMTDYKFLIYDPKKSSAREPENSPNIRRYDADIFVESLVSLNSNTYVGR